MEEKINDAISLSYELEHSHMLNIYRVCLFYFIYVEYRQRYIENVPGF
jgi:hypothetical protein